MLFWFRAVKVPTGKDHHYEIIQPGNSVEYKTWTVTCSAGLVKATTVDHATKSVALVGAADWHFVDAHNSWTFSCY